MDALRDWYARFTAWIFETLLQPAMYELGLMDWADDAFTWLDFFLFGCVQVAVVAAVCLPLERWRPVEVWPSRERVWTDVAYTLLARLGVLPPHLYSHGSSLLGTVQQVAGAMGTALVVMIMTTRAASQVREGVAPAAAQLDGMQWAFAVSAALCAIVLVLVTMLPARIAGGPEAGMELEMDPEPADAVS